MLLRLRDNLKKQSGKPISTAPFDRDFELAVIAYNSAHALAFPCGRILGGWMNAETQEADRRMPEPLARVAEQALVLFFLVVFRYIAGRVIQRRQFGLFLGKQSQKYLSLGPVGFFGQLLTKVPDIQTSDRLIHKWPAHDYEPTQNIMRSNWTKRNRFRVTCGLAGFHDLRRWAAEAPEKDVSNLNTLAIDLLTLIEVSVQTIFLFQRHSRLS